MMSPMHQVMSQQQQVVETTPGTLRSFLQPLRLFIDREYLKTHTKGARGNIMMGNLLLWAPYYVCQ